MRRVGTGNRGHDEGPVNSSLLVWSFLVQDSNIASGIHTGWPHYEPSVFILTMNKRSAEGVNEAAFYTCKFDLWICNEIVLVIFKGTTLYINAGVFS
ncbi:hypothetical protein Pcinc_031903 [Petrolisthes cinctipes]|uniref:Uncharacterized protein n=1 Tax=Petrolisthes cinctipes TaxID=88211 RepID=A0AAE1EVF5_PETCI|nr:hypothetical protein Pcinc_031903 [Petrolisthes cinctipes]